MTLSSTPGLLRVRDTGAQPEVVLARDLRRELKRGHPWLFRDALRPAAPNVDTGNIVRIRARDGSKVGPVIAKGYWDPEGPLAIRVLTTDPRDVIDDAWVRARLARAIDLRTALFADGRTTGYRLVNGEGDGLPGLVVDRYGDTAVVKPDGPVAEAFWDVAGIARWLADTLGLSHVYARYRSRGGARGEPLIGPAPTAPVPFREHGLAFLSDIVHGQKTGFFLDQRENRQLVGALARGRRVLNVFGYTGGFSVYAGAGGATDVTTIDIAPAAIEAANAQWALIDLPPERHHGVTADAFAFLESADARWDLVILDPPAFAPARDKAPQAIAAYRKMVALGTRVASPDAIVVAASCSAHVGATDFLDAVEAGVADARRSATLLTFTAQPPDHPAPLACPELRYLKCAFLLIRP